MSVKSLSVVIPAYNEEANIGSCIENVSKVLKNLKIDSEIIVVNDGSRDKTGEVAGGYLKKIKHFKVIDNNPNRGYGGSLRSGFDAAKKEFIAFVPSDNQFEFAEITKLLKNQEDSGADIVSGIRVGGGVDPFHRKLNRWGWNTIVRALFGYLASDIDCGFKLFKREILQSVNLTSERGAMIDTQLFAGARARGFKVSEVPLTHLPRTAGNSTGANPKVIIQSFVDLFSFWWQLKQEIMVEQGRAVFRYEAFDILLIAGVAGIFRLWNISSYMTFLGDEGRDAIVVKKIVELKHWPLIGPGTSIGNMYLGPLYYYLVSPGYLIFGGSPVGSSVSVGIIGVMTLALLWWISRQWFGRWAALAISLLYAISPTVIIYSRSSWNPNVMPFFALLSAYGIWKVWRLKYWRWLIPVGVSLAFALNSHYLGLLMLPFVGLFWVLSKPKSVVYTVVALTAFLVLMSPLLFFDIKHGYQNFSSFKKFFSERQTTVNLQAQKSLPNLYPIWEQVNTSLLSANNKSVGRPISIALLLGTVLIIVRDKNRKDLLFVSAWVITGLVGLGLYKQHIYDHYFGFLFPAIFLVLGFVLSRIRYLSILVLLPLIYINLESSPLRYPPNRQLQNTKSVSEFIIKESGDKPFNLGLVAKSNYDASYRYFLEDLGSKYQTIHQGIADQLFVICEDNPCEPIGHPLWEIASFGWAKIDNTWEFDHGVRLYRLIHNPSGAP